MQRNVLHFHMKNSSCIEKLQLKIKKKVLKDFVGDFFTLFSLPSMPHPKLNCIPSFQKNPSKCFQHAYQIQICFFFMLANMPCPILTYLPNLKRIQSKYKCTSFSCSTSLLAAILNF